VGTSLEGAGYCPPGPTAGRFCCGFAHQGSPLDGVVGFVDGTLRPISRPGYGQRAFYNGKDRIRALNFQGVIFADGIVAQMAGPHFGRVHDARMYCESDLQGMMIALNSAAIDRAVELHEAEFCLYGDLAYQLSPVFKIRSRVKILNGLNSNTIKRCRLAALR